MISSAFHAVVYLPIYNALVYFVDVVPTHDIGIAVIIVTIIVRFILFPLARRAIKSQMAMKAVPEDSIVCLRFDPKGTTVKHLKKQKVL